jgi:hypothetical protein
MSGCNFHGKEKKKEVNNVGVKVGQINKSCAVGLCAPPDLTALRLFYGKRPEAEDVLPSS